MKDENGRHWGYGSFIDMYQNEITLYPSSNVDGGMWLKIEGNKQEGTGHLSIEDAKVLAALLEKAIKAQEENE